MKKIYFLVLFALLSCFQLKAQVSNYSFSPSAGTYTPITGGTVITTSVNGTPNLDSYVSSSVTIPAFTLAGTSYTSMYVTSNGQVSLGGTTAPSSFSYTALTSSFGSNAILAPMSADLDDNLLLTSEIRWEEVGNEIIVQWSNFKRYGLTENFNFQVRMDKVSGVVKFVYDGTPPYDASTSYQPQVGIKSAVGAYSNARVTASSSWASPTILTTAGGTSIFTGATGFTSGLTYAWTPPVPCTGTPTAGTLNGTIQNLCTGSTPSAIVATGFTTGQSGITFQWEESDDNGVGDAWANAVGGTGATTTSYTPASFAGTSIFYRLTVTCSASGLTNSSTSFNVAPPSNPSTAASVITTTAILNNSLSLSWTNGNGGRRYVVINSTNSFTDPVNGTTAPATAATLYAGTGEQVIYDGTGSSVTTTGLLCNTTYYVRVYEYLRCGTTPNFDYYYNTTTSATNPASFMTTQPTVASLPASNNFTGFTGANLATVFPGWYEAFGATSPSGTTSAWANSTVFTQTTAKINLYTTTRNEWIVSPKVMINADSRIKFKAAITDYNSAAADATGMQGTDDKVMVMVSTDGCGLVWTPVYTFEAANTTTLTNVLTDYIVSLNAYVGQTIQIAFKATDGPIDDTPDYDFHIGSVVIENVPTCDLPTALVATNVISTSATISWTAPAVAPASGYEYFYSTTNTAPTAAGTAEAGTTVNLTMLTADTMYYVWVRSICATGNESAWTVATSFYTGHCIPASTSALTYIDNFSTTNAFVNASNLTSGYTATGYQNNYATTAISEFVNGSFDINSTIVGGDLGMAIWIDWNNNLVFETSEVVHTTTAYSFGPFDVTVTIPSTTVPGDYRMRVMVDYNDSNPGDDTACSFGSGRGEVEDYKLTVLAQPTDDVDFANLQSIVANGAAVSTIETCQTINVYTQGWQAGVTDASATAAGAGIEVWIAKSATDTDPSTWTEATWTVATYNTDAGNNDEFVANFTGLTTGNHYFASRWRLNNGPYKYGATGGFWNATTNPNTALSVTDPIAINTAADNPSVCVGGSSVLTASSTNADYAYVWNDVAATVGATLTVSPTTTTTYMVTGTSSLTNCTSTSSITIVVNPLPTVPTITASNNTVCAGEIVSLSASSSDVVTLFNEGFESGVPPTNWTSFIGTNGLGTTNNWTTSTISNTGTKAAYVSYEYVTGGNAEDWLVTPMINLSGVTSPNLSFFTRQSFGSDYGSTFYVKVSTTSQTDMASFTNVANWTETTLNTTYNVYESKSVDLSAYVGQQVYLAFVMVNNDGDSWFIDDVAVSATAQNNVTWSAATNLYTDALATVAYVANTPANMVYFKSATSGTETITASATSMNTCVSTATTDITVNVTATPTGDALQTVNVAVLTDATIANLVATGTNIVWYASAADAMSGTSPLASTTQVFDGTTYYATQTVGSCTSPTSLAVTVTVALGTKGFDLSKLKYYPNPVVDNVSFSYTNTISTIEVYNLLGQKVISMKPNTSEFDVNMSSLQAGTYIIQLESEGLVERIKLIKK